MKIPFLSFILMPILITLTFINSEYLIYLLIFFLSLQSTVIFNIGHYGFQVYRFITILLSILLIFKIINKFKLSIKVSYLKSIIVIGAIFFIYATFISSIGPFLFEGHIVNSVKGMGLYSHLHFNKYNIAYQSFLWLYFFVLIYILQKKYSDKFIKRLIMVFYFSITFVFLIAFLQFLIPFGFPDIFKIINNTSERNLNRLSPMGIGRFVRVSATFLEPSMFAPFVVGVLSISLDKLFKKFSFNWLFVFFIALFFNITSTSTTAYVASFVMIFIITGSRFLRNSKKIITNTIKKMMIIFTIIMAGLLIVIVKFPDILSSIYKLLELYIIYKSKTGSFHQRTAADSFAVFHVFPHSYFLGVGLGSNRPSSLIPFLLSTVGIIGFILFFIFIYKIFKFCKDNLKDTPYSSFIYLIVAIILSMGIAYPDITNPTLWQFIYFSIILAKYNYDKKVEATKTILKYDF